MWRNEMNKCPYNDLTTDEKYSVRLKIATRKYEVHEQSIIVCIDLGERKVVEISKENSTEFRDLEFSVWEPIYKKVEKQLQGVDDEHFIEILEEYKNHGGILGTQIKNNLFIKFYSLEKPNDTEREDVGRKWIDYNSQFLKDKIIYDIKEGYGIWATNACFIYNAMEATWRYGENIMILAPIMDLQYVISDNEIVGDKFEVKMHGSLTDEKTWNSLLELLGDGLVEEMPYHILDKYDGAKKIYDRYWSDKNIAQTGEIIKKKGLLKNIIERLFK